MPTRPTRAQGDHCYTTRALTHPVAFDQISGIAQQMQTMSKKNENIEKVNGYWIKTIDDFKGAEDVEEPPPSRG